MKKSKTSSTNNLQDLEKGAASGGRLDRPERAADSIAKSSKSFRATYNSDDVILAWKDLTVESTRGKGRLLLDNVSGSISAGFYAIMGPSGSGKTTLLNTLACRLDRGVKVHGYVRLNGQEYNNTVLKKMAGYVMQDDLLNVNFTVQETLYYTAQLRLPVELTTEEKQARIDKVMEQVGITHCRDTIVGSPMKKGISGGERKRLCVAMELLMEPLLLFLDEPTSGLDSMTALSLCRLLKNLADQKVCSVICTLHQPQAKIFNMFDFLILLKSGSIAYQGPAGSALEHFATIGFPCPTHENPADHFLDVISPYNPNDSVEDLVKKAEAIKLYYTAPEVDLHAGADRPLILPREVTPWTKQFNVLLRRSLKEQWRKRNIVIVQVIQAVIMAVLIGTAFLQIGTSQTSVTRRQPVLFFCCINQGIFGALIMINSFPSERMLSLRERAAGTYNVSAYFLAKITAETVTQLLTPVIFSCIVYWLVGLQPVAGKFFIFMAFMVLCSLSSTSLALMVSAIARTTDMSVTILPMVLEISRLFGGYFLSPANLPAYFSWLDALSFVKYSYVAVSLNELNGLKLYCTPSQYKYTVPANSHPNGTAAVCTSQCPYTSGQQTIDQLGLDFLTIAQCAGILISYITICRIFAYLGVRFIKW